MCPNKNIPSDQKGFLDIELFKKIIDESSSYIGAAFFFVRGEPLLHNKIHEMIAYAAEHNVRSLLHTNATTLSKEKASALIEAGLDYLSFSFDGMDKMNYKKIRVNADFDDTLHHINDFLKIKKEMKSRKPYTVIQILRTGSAHYENEEIASKNFYSLFNGLPIDEINERIPHNFGNAFQAKENSNVFSPCSYLWSAITILCDGSVVPCCLEFTKELCSWKRKREKII